MTRPSNTIEAFERAARKRWNRLTEDDFDSIKSSASELAARLQARYAVSAEDARKQADAFFDDLGDQTADAYRRGARAVDRASTQVADVVRHNALASFGGALLLGAVVGFIVGSESRHSRR